MKFGKYLSEEDSKDKTEAQSKIKDFFKENPEPSDADIHAFAEAQEMDTHKFEELVYDLLGDFLGSGMSKDFKGEYDEAEMKMGIEIEMEHTSNATLAKRIAMDHLAEIPDYYTRLKKMESEAEG